MIRLRAALLGLGLLLLAGCSSIPLGPVQRPEIYPDRTDHERAFATYLWAWNSGDVDVLLQVLGMYQYEDLKKEIETNGVDKVSEFYRGSGDLCLVELEWTKVGEALAYVRVVLSSSVVARAELDFSMLERPDGWVVTGKRLLR